ncbi:hypothetical protein KKI17_00515 [Patescibacteria group bacterium]|nr:hypothetical protein [Patescibacteria group bacterium]
MSLEVQKTEREPNQGLVRRFMRRLRNSGILVTTKKNKFRKRKPSDRLKKRTALRRLSKKKEFERLQKLGKVEARR